MEIVTMYEQLGVSRAVYEYGEAVLRDLRPRFDVIDQTAEYNQGKVLAAMQKNRVNATHFAATTGYGYNDEGRDNLERVYADVFHTEAALVRPQITCGTHALTIALSANLLPGDELLSPVGAPYDTLEEVIGIRESKCSLKEYGVTYAQADLKPDGTFDYDAIREKINGRTKLITIQRSKGYATRPSFSVRQIGELIAFCKGIKPDVKIMVDNCYGEFVETIEPSDLGADMVVGSLIKNPGGGLAPIGGYICGTKGTISFANNGNMNPMDSLEVYLDAPERGIRGWLKPMEWDIPACEMNFFQCKVVQDLIYAIEEDRPVGLPPEHARHVVDIMCTIPEAIETKSIVPLHTTF